MLKTHAETHTKQVEKMIGDWRDETDERSLKKKKYLNLLAAHAPQRQNLDESKFWITFVAFSNS